MKNWGIVLGILVILTLLFSPTLAISKSDLILQYKTGQFPGPATPIPTSTSTVPSWFITPKPVPTQVPTGTGTGTLVIGAIHKFDSSWQLWDCKVYLDGGYQGVTPVNYTTPGAIRGFGPLMLRNIPAGPHQVRVTKEGYQDYTIHVIVAADRETYVDAYLVPLYGPDVGTESLSILSEPSGAFVFLDSKLKGLTPLTLTGISAGSHQLRLTKYGYADFTTSVTVVSGKATRILATLDKVNGYYYADDLPSRKPNIYLYNDRDLVAQVRLSPERAITVSEPAYKPGKGWLAEIRNGSLNGAGDFLFYEAMVPDSGWQKKEGYVIHRAYREQDMAFMLGQYGFNEKETTDFIEYWTDHLTEDVDYVFFPQETDTVNRVMPLYISPKPDHVSRIWFYAEPLMSEFEPVTHPEKIVRERFYVVEWGVVIRDEYRI